MANVTRYDPFDVALDPFDDLFRGFLRPVRFEGQPQQMQIKMDVKENDKVYTVHAEIPGVKKEDIQVSIDGAQVTLSAEVKREREATQDERVLHVERVYGKAMRSFTLPQELDEAKVEAKYHDGVLKLTLPKKTAAARKQIAIQ